MRKLSLLLFCAALLALPGLVSAQSASEPVQTESTIEVGTDAVSDAEIRGRIERLLREFSGYDKVRVSVSEGVVTLSGTVIDNTAKDQLTKIADRVAGVVAINNKTELSASLEERLTPAAERIANRARDLMANAPIFLVAVAAFLVVAIGGWFLTSRLPVWDRIAPNRFISDVYRAVARIVFIVLGVVLALDILNATALIGAVLGAAGVVGLALGFAVRDTVENFIASILLSLRQPFRPDDFVDIQGDTGIVARLTSRATILISPEGNHIRIPNATVYKGRIVNFTRDPHRRFDFELGVDADADLAAAMATAVAALEGLSFVLNDPAVGAWVEKVGDSNVVLIFTGWVDQRKTSFPKARGEAIRTAKTALESAGFGLPEPIYRVRLDGQAPGGPPHHEAAQERPVRPAASTADETALPAASDPARKEHAQTEAASRERALGENEENLLDPSQKAE
ncbi:small-conductance mechanosensitive channel [Aliiruegeria haliotis]|uniref:Small-conductance mechanosensitive channel n=1 Tax=Aliiruegeria haliotis TaxID=1280846 RepID=A0A2T0RLX2_9RHOB|nr:mechanosensitive ion channel domain-containing protein [Aliiruegeria haliotis]PRY22131.1 small-conductance mechanosensitive channel [Aliiruegeria haliotis]